MRKAILLAAALTACADQRSFVRAATRIGQPVQLTAPDVAGKTVDVSADPGRVRVIDFWASWCDPCREEMPALDALLREQGARGLAIYGVSFDEDLEQVREFQRQVTVSFPILWDRGGSRYSALYRIDRLPTTFVVDRRGVIRFVHQAYDASIAAETRREVEQLLAEPP
jgi:cytochrome c biogenesis protein CcmG/thiol:disulfide interchange protein DsbE